jgi:hypothetical protein
LSRNLEDGEDILGSLNDPYNIYKTSEFAGGMLIDDIPAYCFWVMLSDIGPITITLLRTGVREKYPKSLYKVAKNTAQEWANKIGFLRCSMLLDGSKEAMDVFNWALKIGYKIEGEKDGRYIMTLYGKGVSNG